jgi:predicted nucleotidyltransferase
MNAVATKQDVLGRIRAHGGKIRALGVEALGLFGSFVRGEPGRGEWPLRHPLRECLFD